MQDIEQHPDSPWLLNAPADAVTDSLGATYLSVEDSAWTAWQPDLPDKVAAYLASPLLVGATPVK